MGHRACRYLCICLLVLLGTAHLWADVTGSIQGYVRDSSGAVISGAHVVVTEIATNVSREASTDSQGSYTFLALPPGRYKIIATMTGFQQSTVNNVDLSVNDKLAFDLTLPVGSVQQNVSVEANALQVQTSVTSTGTTIESPQILAMPLNGRSYLDLLSLQAGVSPANTNSRLQRSRSRFWPLRALRAMSPPTASPSGPTPSW